MTTKSFSSSLLDEIYNSFDNNNNNNNNNNHLHHHRMMNKSTSTSTFLERERENPRFLVDRWIDQNKFNHSRPIIDYSSSSTTTSSSSDSSSGTGGFSFSDTDSLYSSKSKPKPQLKPIRTVNPPETRRKSYSDEVPAGKKSKKEGNLQRRALKLYGDLKKVRQPISPGGKLASFLNSLFNSASATSKKPKLEKSTVSSKPERESATATSRSCLSKTPSSAGGGRFERRSVRFVDDNDVAKRHSSSSMLLVNDEEFKVQVREKHRRVEEVAKELLKNYSPTTISGRREYYRSSDNNKDLTLNVVTDYNYNGRKFDSKLINERVNNVCSFKYEDDEEEEEDDDGSCCSSDLFELENFLEIGVVDRYREELPVYETTHVGTNRAIANGFIL